MSKTKKVSKRRNNPYDDLYRSVAAYVKSKGGSVMVCGGIQVQEWPGDGLYQFTIAVKCTGRKPKVDATKEGE